MKQVKITKLKGQGGREIKETKEDDNKR